MTQSVQLGNVPVPEAPASFPPGGEFIFRNFNISSSSNGLSDQLRQYLRSWSGHVRSWIDESGLPIYPVRYEGMLLDSETTFKGVVQFCGLDGNDERIRKAVAFSDFSELQCQEREKGFRERPAFATEPFNRLMG